MRAEGTPPAACAQDSPDGFEVLVVAALPQQLVDRAGAPAQVWYHITSPSSDDRLLFDVLWVNKTPSRLPEVRVPAGAVSDVPAPFLQPSPPP